MDRCVFCQIIKGKIPAQIIYQDDKTIALLDHQPKSAGHTLVIPKSHFATIFDTPSNQLFALINTTQIVAKLINKALSPNGLNICQNNGAIAGQTINHIHFHIIPRYQKRPPINKKDFLALAKKINQ